MNKKQNEKNGMSTKVWGPSGWMIMFATAMCYPLKPTRADKQHYKQFFTAFKWTLPCGLCRNSYSKFIQEMPIDNYLGSRRQLTKWVYNLKKKVNAKLGVKYNPPFNTVVNKYERYRAKCTATPKSKQSNFGKTKKSTKTKKIKNEGKGCVVPVNGKRLRCVLKIVKCT